MIIDDDFNSLKIWFMPLKFFLCFIVDLFFANEIWLQLSLFIVFTHTAHYFGMENSHKNDTMIYLSQLSATSWNAILLRWYFFVNARMGRDWVDLWYSLQRYVWEYFESLLQAFMLNLTLSVAQNLMVFACLLIHLNLRFQWLERNPWIPRTINLDQYAQSEILLKTFLPWTLI